MSTAEHVHEPAAGSVYDAEGRWMPTASQAAGKGTSPFRGICRVCGHWITRTREGEWELMPEALTVPCPLCRAGVGRACLKMSATNNSWDMRRTKHPHRERIARARE
jgi:hypothetical protein